MFRDEQQSRAVSWRSRSPERTSRVVSIQIAVTSRNPRPLKWPEWAAKTATQFPLVHLFEPFTGDQSFRNESPSKKKNFCLGRILWHLPKRRRRADARETTGVVINGGIDCWQRRVKREPAVQPLLWQSPKKTDAGDWNFWVSGASPRHTNGSSRRLCNLFAGGGEAEPCKVCCVFESAWRSPADVSDCRDADARR